MPSQYDYLVGEDLRPRLTRHDQAAEIELVRRYNRGRPKAKQIEVPVPGTTICKYDHQLLALLWSLAGNQEALILLAKRAKKTPLHCLPGTDPPDFSLMCPELLRAIWTLGRHDQALDELWRREGLLPVEVITETTPTNVIGFLWWRHRRLDARDELFRRCHNKLVTDWAQTRAVKLLIGVDRWDYLNHPHINGFLYRCMKHDSIDSNRSGEALPASDLEEVANPLDPLGREPDAGPVAEDELAASVPIEILIIYKVKLNSEDSPFDLTAEELEYAARKNLRHAGVKDPTTEVLAVEKARIVKWMINHPEPAGTGIPACLMWYDASKLATEERIWRIQWFADQNNHLLPCLLKGSSDLSEELAGQVQTTMDELALRVAKSNQLGKDLPAHGPVATFAHFEEASQCLWGVLAARNLDDAQTEALGEWRSLLRRFADEFPILSKLAPCYRLAARLLLAGIPALMVPRLFDLFKWLEQGQWLAQFRVNRREKPPAKVQCQIFQEDMKNMLAQVTGDQRAALELIVLWLRAAPQPGLAAPHWHDLNRIWWLSHDLGPSLPAGMAKLSNELIAAAYLENWSEVAEKTNAMLPLLATVPNHRLGPIGRELQDCLRRLSRMNREDPVASSDEEPQP